MAKFTGFMMLSAIIIFCIYEIVLNFSTPTNGTPVTSNSKDYNYQVNYLFSEKGCNLYRFQDNGDAHYFSTCQGKVINTINYRCGRNYCEKHDDINTTFFYHSREI